MIKIIFNIIGVIIGFGLLIIGIILGGRSMIMMIEELVVINENIGYGVLGMLYGFLVFIFGYKIIQWITKG